MDDLIWWFGAIHLAAYALVAFLAGSVIGVSLFTEWLIRRLRLKGEMLKAYQKVLQEREATRTNPT